MTAKNNLYFDFEVTLQGIQPKIWRRFLLTTNATFFDLHRAIQDALGWSNTHLFGFFPTPRSRDEIAGLPDEDNASFGKPSPDSRKIKLSSYFKQDGPETCAYQYDFGDSWEHLITLKQVVSTADKFRRRLLDGARACPLEDSGGTLGYYDCVNAVKLKRKQDVDIDPEDREYIEELLEWVDDWDPEKFDLDEFKQSFDQ